MIIQGYLIVLILRESRTTCFCWFCSSCWFSGFLSEGLKSGTWVGSCLISSCILSKSGGLKSSLSIGIISAMVNSGRVCSCGNLGIRYFVFSVFTNSLLSLFNSIPVIIK